MGGGVGGAVRMMGSVLAQVLMRVGVGLGGRVEMGAGVGGGGGKRGRTGLRLQPVSASASESFRDVSSRLGCVHLRAPRRGTPWRQGHGTMLKWHSWRTTSGRGHGTRILS